MNYRILTSKAKSKTQIRREALKWFLYTICLLMGYALMSSGAFVFWQPFLIIPLAVSVSLFERELSSCVFALFCGYLIDIACHFLFGFSAVWLMIICLFASLLSRNLIRANIINFLWIDFIAVFLEFAMDYLFNVFIWDTKNREILLNKSIIPSAIATMIVSPIIYLLVKCIYNKLGTSSAATPYFNESDSDEDDSIPKIDRK